MQDATRVGSRQAVLPARRLFTADEYERMAVDGILREGERVELIEGELLQMAATGSRHAACVSLLAEWFISRLIERALVRSALPLRLDGRTEPEPDLALVRRRTDHYRSAHPGPRDVLLLIEVADTSLAYDRDIKVGLYAAAGIPEAWLVDLPGRRVLVYREPCDGAYGRTVTREPGAMLTPEAFPDLALPVAALFD